MDLCEGREVNPAVTCWWSSCNERYKGHVTETCLTCQKRKKEMSHQSWVNTCKATVNIPIDSALSRGSAKEWTAWNQKQLDPFQWIHFGRWANPERSSHETEPHLFPMHSFKGEYDVQHKQKQAKVHLQQGDSFQRARMWGKPPMSSPIGENMSQKDSELRSLILLLQISLSSAVPCLVAHTSRGKS